MNTINEIFTNKVITVSVISWAVAQSIKIIIDFIKNKTINPSLIVSTGGMPSSHSALVAALSTSIGFTEGFASTIFALSFIISLVIMYDASGIRRAAGKQAEVLNKFIQKSEKYGIKIDDKLKELLGHSPIEVLAGAILGIVIAMFMY